jgi:hypothetical protein
MTKLTMALICSIIFCLMIPGASLGQGSDSPSVVVKEFYQHLRARHYIEGLRLSVYRPAIEGLSEEEIRNLEPEFTRIIADLPNEIETRGEQISGDDATVFVKSPKEKRMQEVSLVRIDGTWRVGDRETYQLAMREGRSFFFNARNRISEAEAYDWLLEILGAEAIYFKAKQRFTTLDELVGLGGVSKQLINGSESGYRFRLSVSNDGQSFRVIAVPAEYGRTGRFSFYIDQSNAIRAEDKEGQPATASSPPYQPGKE